MWPLSWTFWRKACTATRWSGSVVRMKRSGAMSSRSQVSWKRADVRSACSCGRDAVGLGGPGDLEAVLVGAGEEEDVVADQAVPAGQGVGGDRRVGVPDVGHVVHVVDRGGQEEAAGHRFTLARGPSRPAGPWPPGPRPTGAAPTLRPSRPAAEGARTTMSDGTSGQDDGARPVEPPGAPVFRRRRAAALPGARSGTPRRAGPLVAAAASPRLRRTGPARVAAEPPSRPTTRGPAHLPVRWSRSAAACSCRRRPVLRLGELDSYDQRWQRPGHLAAVHACSAS